MKGPDVVRGIRGILFDMDGTLFSTQNLTMHCVNETSQKYLNRILHREDKLWSFGPPVLNIIRQFASSSPDVPAIAPVDYYSSL